MAFSNITNENFLLYAAEAYETPQNVLAELPDDLKHFKYIKRLFRKYRATGELTERLILNHLIVLYNVFNNHATRMLFLRVDPADYSCLKTFLLFLARLPTMVYGVNGMNIDTRAIGIDAKIVNILRNI